MKKDLAFLYQFFYPEYNSSAALPVDTEKRDSGGRFRILPAAGIDLLKKGRDEGFDRCIGNIPTEKGNA